MRRILGRIARPFAVALAGVGAVACTRAAAGPDALDGARSPAVERLWNLRCASCHGDDGKGHGPAAARLGARPTDLTDLAWQLRMTDADIRKVIARGGKAVGLSPLMPPSPDLEGRPELLDALVARIRALRYDIRESSRGPTIPGRDVGLRGAPVGHVQGARGEGAGATMEGGEDARATSNDAGGPPPPPR